MSSFLEVAAPQSEAQRKRLVLAAARRARKAYRKADTSGEVLERWLDRQIDRKTRIMPAQVVRGVQLFQRYFADVRAVEVGMADLATTATQM